MLIGDCYSKFRNGNWTHCSLITKIPLKTIYLTGVIKPLIVFKKKNKKNKKVGKNRGGTQKSLSRPILLGLTDDFTYKPYAKTLLDAKTKKHYKENMVLVVGVVFVKYKLPDLVSDLIREYIL